MTNGISEAKIGSGAESLAVRGRCGTVPSEAHILPARMRAWSAAEGSTAGVTYESRVTKAE
jgi:hypothetical protein